LVSTPETYFLVAKLPIEWVLDAVVGAQLAMRIGSTSYHVSDKEKSIWPDKAFTSSKSDPANIPNHQCVGDQGVKDMSFGTITGNLFLDLFDLKGIGQIDGPTVFHRILFHSFFFHLGDHVLNILNSLLEVFDQVWGAV
jgi:hypothetical protein